LWHQLVRSSGAGLQCPLAPWQLSSAHKRKTHAPPPSTAFACTSYPLTRTLPYFKPIAELERLTRVADGPGLRAGQGGAGALLLQGRLRGQGRRGRAGERGHPHARGLGARARARVGEVPMPRTRCAVAAPMSRPSGRGQQAAGAREGLEGVRRQGRPCRSSPQRHRSARLAAAACCAGLRSISQAPRSAHGGTLRLEPAAAGASFITGRAHVLSAPSGAAARSAWTPCTGRRRSTASGRPPQASWILQV